MEGEALQSRTSAPWGRIYMAGQGIIRKFGKYGIRRRYWENRVFNKIKLISCKKLVST